MKKKKPNNKRYLIESYRDMVNAVRDSGNIDGFLQDLKASLMFSIKAERELNGMVDGNAFTWINDGRDGVLAGMKIKCPDGEIKISKQ